MSWPAKPDICGIIVSCRKRGNVIYLPKLYAKFIFFKHFVTRTRVINNEYVIIFDAVKRCALVHACNEVIVIALSPATVIQPRYRNNIHTFCGHTIQNDIYFLMVRIQIYCFISARVTQYQSETVIVISAWRHSDRIFVCYKIAPYPRTRKICQFRMFEGCWH